MFQKVLIFRQSFMNFRVPIYDKKRLSISIQRRLLYTAYPEHQKFTSISFTSDTKTKPLNFCEHSEYSQSINDEEEEKKLKVLKLEVDVLLQEGHRVPNPDLISSDNWSHALSLKSKSARRKYYSFLWQLERKAENKLYKKERRREENELRKSKEKLESETNEHLTYALSHNTIFLRIYDSTINHWHNNRLIQAMQYGQKLIFDCSYDDNMTKREAVNAAKQLMLCFAENRIHQDPFDLHFCNANFSCTTMQHLERHIPTMHEPWFPLNIHKQCFTDLYNKKQLVYLTPHCKEELIKFNSDDIYIIGCMVDKINNEPLSLAKAKKMGLRMARLPLDRYLSWGSGSGKSLTLNQMTNILLDVKVDGDWKNALRHVPKRKLIDDSIRNDSKGRRSITIQRKKI